MKLVPAEKTQPVETVVAKLLTERKQTLAVAESCTGGLITHRLTNIPGSSVFLIVGVIAYAYEAKVIALGVSWETLNKYGAVSEETALAMARGVRERFSTSLGLSVTGIAGPGGATADKPVGLTYIALVSGNDQVIERHVWQGDRIRVKEQSAQAALELLRRHLEQKAPRR
jgi:nicotinamide-nucleotide amidase